MPPESEQKPADPAPQAWGPKVAALESKVAALEAKVVELEKLGAIVRDFLGKMPAAPTPPGAPPSGGKRVSRWG